MQNSITYRTKMTRFFAVGVILAICAGVPWVSSLAQKRSKEKPPRVTGITSQKVANGEVISLVADSAFNGVQTWQDANGSFHLILPGSGESEVTNSPSGVKVRRVGNSLEIEVQARRGSTVTVDPRSNRLDLVVNGGIDAKGSTTNLVASPNKTPSTRREVAPLSNPTQSAGVPRVKAPIKGLPSLEQAPANLVTQSLRLEQASTPLPASPAPSAQPPAPPAVQVPEPQANDLTEQSAFVSFVYKSGWWVTLLVIAALVGLVFWRRREKSGWEVIEEVAPAGDLVAAPQDFEAINAIVGERRHTNRRGDQRAGGNRSTDRKARKQKASGFDESLERYPEPRSPATTQTPDIVYGAYRVDQEVGKLILGQAHRMDVLASRGADDRRAMETALLKALRSTDTDEGGRRKARQALEEYGFVARQSAAVLLAQDPCERVAAARFLGEVGLSTSLQFLLEALYDTDTIVRTQAVESIGALKLPSAIGALLDIARRYPDVSNTALSNALNACSIDSLDFLDSSSGQSALLLSGGSDSLSCEITQLEPSATFQDLPDSSEDELLVDTLAHLQSSDADVRAMAAQTLAIYRVKRSVSALKALTTSDSEPAVRAAAVASLGSIDHESVFSSVLVALADEARDVRAAAARAVSRLSFDRADAYARVIEMSDLQELSDVACACIKTGLAAQALDRLSNEDRRQAYEAYSLLSLLVKADQCQPILDFIEKHADVKTCTAAVELLGLSHQPDVVAQLRQLAVRDGMPEQLRTALMEVVYKIDQMQPA